MAVHYTCDGCGKPVHGPSSTQFLVGVHGPLAEGSPKEPYLTLEITVRQSDSPAHLCRSCQEALLYRAAAFMPTAHQDLAGGRVPHYWREKS